MMRLDAVGLIMPAKKLIHAVTGPASPGISPKRGRNPPRRRHVAPSPTHLRSLSTGVFLMNKTADLHSMPVEVLRREIRKIAARINRCASMDELDQAWATLCRLQDALAVVVERKALAD